MKIASFRVKTASVMNARSRATQPTHCYGSLRSAISMRRAGVVGFVFLAALMGLTGPAIASNVSHRKLSPLERGLAFYRGKTITFLAGTAAGTGSDINSRAISQQMATYLHATINVVNNSSGNGVASEDELAASHPSGLTIGYFDPGSTYSAILSNAPGLNFNIERETLLGGLTATPSVVSTISTSPFTSFASLLTADPSSMKVLGVQAGGASDEANLLFEIYRLKPQYIFAYTGNNQLTTGFLRGDGNIVTSSPSQFQVQIAAHSVRVLAVLTTKSLPTTQSWAAPLTGVPTVAQIIKKYPPKNRKIATYLTTLTSLDNIMVAAPTKTPTVDVDALTAAVKFAVHSAYVRNELAARGSAWGWISGAAEKAAYVSAMTHVTAIRAALAP